MQKPLIVLQETQGAELVLITESSLSGHLSDVNGKKP